MIVSISPEAERELTDAAILYAEQESTELGLAFIVEFERALEVLREHKLRSALARHDAALSAPAFSL